VGRKHQSNRATIILGDSRSMAEVDDGAIALVVTSPPYWHIKDYGSSDQIGFGQTLHEYLGDLYRVWAECFRVLMPGARLCVNIGDQFARAATYGRYKVIPLHAEVISQCEAIGFDFMGSIIWQKKTTVNTTGGATVMGSFPYPPNGIVEIDYEYIHILKKPGRSRRVSKRSKEASRLAKDVWKQYFSGHWRFAGARKLGHEAMFPDELPRRLIRMFSFVGDTVLDPFAGSGTTLKVALDLRRDSIGYEVNRDFIKVMRSKLAGIAPQEPEVSVIRRRRKMSHSEVPYMPSIQNARPAGPARRRPPEALHKVTAVTGENTIRIGRSRRVRFLGVKITDAAKARDYLRRYVLGKEVFLRFDGDKPRASGEVAAYVYLKNRIFINAHLIRAGLGIPDPGVSHSLRTRFMSIMPT
jgi:DNA modification methylase